MARVWGLIRIIFREVVNFVLAFCMVFVLLVTIYFQPESWGAWQTLVPTVLCAYFIVKFMDWRSK